MENVRGRILKDERVVLDDLDITIYHATPAADVPSWRGGFYLDEPGAHIDPGEYRLVLEDGRSGEVVIGSVSLGMSNRTRVSFNGSGSLDLYIPPPP